jgi:hypothetical protein
MALFDFLKQKEIDEIERLKAELAQFSKYHGIIDVDKVIHQKMEDLREMENKILLEKSLVEKEISTLRNDYAQNLETYKRLKRQIDIFSESLELSDYGMYEPHFDFETSEIYKGEIGNIRDRQKDLISSGQAVVGGEQITWNGSLAKGQIMIKKEKKLMMRAFNGECDSFISSVEWNNVKRMEERILRSYESINQAYKDQGIYITAKYNDLKIEELRLAYEYKKKKFDEKEEQRQIRDQMREEEKAAREIEAALLKAEKDKDTFQKAIEKAKKEAEVSQGGEHDKLMRKILELEQKLVEVQEKKERALSMAQQTKRGHVYIISNIGSFGENVYKIGMTRRLDPQDRVKELGDASVPFQFDTHAMIYSENAPELETSLHKVFDLKKINMVNQRREFFSVTLEEIENEVKKLDINAEFIKLPEAMEYHETIAIRDKMNQPYHKEYTAISEFPEMI